MPARVVEMKKVDLRQIRKFFAAHKICVDPEIKEILEELKITPTGNLECDILSIEKTFNALKKKEIKD